LPEFDFHWFFESRPLEYPEKPFKEMVIFEIYRKKQVVKLKKEIIVM